MPDSPGPVVSLAVAEALSLRPDVDVVVALGSAELRDGLAGAYRDAEVRHFSDVGAGALEPALFDGATLVVAELPKSHAELDEWAQFAAAHGAADVAFVGAGRDKHMSHGLNDQLARSFAEVSASRGVRKARALRATGPRPDAVVDYPRTATVAGLPFAVTAHGGAFAGPKLDIGTRALLDVLDVALVGVPDGTALDLGCGTGVLATSLALRRPDMTVLASDVSWAAVASTRATAAGAGVRVEARQEDGAAGIADASVDLVLFNPPFHTGHAVVEDMAHRLFAEAARVLRPGGVLVCVFNSHLPHRAALERAVGPTRQLSRTPKFTVTASTRR